MFLLDKAGTGKRGHFGCFRDRLRCAGCGRSGFICAHDVPHAVTLADTKRVGGTFGYVESDRCARNNSGAWLST